MSNKISENTIEEFAKRHILAVLYHQTGIRLPEGDYLSLNRFA